MFRGLLVALRDSSGKQLFMPGYWSGQTRSFDIPLSDKKPPPEKPSLTCLKLARTKEKPHESPVITTPKKNPGSCSSLSNNETSLFCSTIHWIFCLTIPLSQMFCVFPRPPCNNTCAVYFSTSSRRRSCPLPRRQQILGICAVSVHTNIENELVRCPA